MRRWWNLCLAGILAFVLGSVGVAETHFVDSSAGDGGRNAPLRTIGQALSRGVAGDVIRLRKGMFREALAWRDTIIADNAFPAFEQFVFDEMRATPREMGLAILEVTMVDGATMDDSDLSGEVIFDRYADALGKVDLRELLPSGFDPVVPLPGAAWMGGPLLVVAGVVGKGRRSRKRF